MRLQSTALLTVVLLVLIGTAVSAAPTAEFHAYRVSGTSETLVLLDASESTDPEAEIVRYQWVFGDGTTGSGEQVEHAFPRVDRFNVTLLATNDAGSWHMITKTIDLSLLLVRPAGGTDTSGTATVSGETAETPIAADVPIGNSVGRRAPEFRLPKLDGEFVSLSDFLGYVVLLEFWQSTCPGCITSTPHLEALRRAYGEQGLVVLLISLDGSARDAQRFLEESGYNGFVVVREARPISVGTMAEYSVTGTPTAFLIDRTGVIRYRGFPSGIADELVADWL